MELNSFTGDSQIWPVGEDECLQMLFERKYGRREVCPCCGNDFKYYRVKKRKCYECKDCGNQVYPMKDTIFEGSKTPLVKWFQIIEEFCNDHRGVSAKSISRKYKLTYKAAWRICHKIREGITAIETERLVGTIEIDETYIGGKRKLKPGTELKGIGDKQVVFGMLAREGKLRMVHVPQKTAQTIRPLIYQTIDKGATIHHDNNGTYGNLEEAGYKHKLVGKKGCLSFHKGVHNNNIETAWSRLKKYMAGTYTAVGDKHLQAYLNEFAFRYNYRDLRYTDEFIAVFWKVCLKGQ